MSEHVPFQTMFRVLNRQPQAMATLHGSNGFPAIFGHVYFYQMADGVMVAAWVTGLPKRMPDSTGGFYGFHIHSGSKCAGTAEDPFADALTHYNPREAPHPSHAGDLPPLLGNHGYAFQVFFTDRFSVRELLHRRVVIHSMPDDFISQPAGNAGQKIACGEIEAYRKQ